MIRAVEQTTATQDIMAWGVGAAIILALGALGYALYVATVLNDIRTRVDVLDDRATPSFADEHEMPEPEVPAAIREFAEADTDARGFPAIEVTPKPSPRPRTDTGEAPAVKATKATAPKAAPAKPVRKAPDTQPVPAVKPAKRAPRKPAEMPTSPAHTVIADDWEVRHEKMMADALEAIAAIARGEA